MAIAADRLPCGKMTKGEAPTRARARVGAISQEQLTPPVYSAPKSNDDRSEVEECPIGAKGGIALRYLTRL
jgi:hypothetical protein